MKRNVLFMAMLFISALTFAQEKNIKVISTVSTPNQSLRDILGDDRYEIDSIAILYGSMELTWKDFATLLDCCERGRLTGIDISRCRNVKSIPDFAFYPSTINGMPRNSGSDEEKNMFRTNLRYIKLPVWLESIGDRAFAFTNLQSVEIPYWVGSIGNMAFGDCTELRSMTLLGNNRKLMHDCWDFFGLAPDAVLYVAEGQGDYFRNAEGWSAFSSVQESEKAYKVMDVSVDGGNTLLDVLGDYNMRVDSIKVSGTLSEDDVLLLKENSLYGRLCNLDLYDCEIAETGKMYSCKMEALRMPRHMTKIPNVFLSDAVVGSLYMPESYDEVGLTAFENFNSFPDSTLIIAEGCRKIGYKAFCDCKCVNKIVLPSTLDVLEPASLALNWSWQWLRWDVDLYINRMYPPETTDYIGDYGVDEKPAEVGPFACELAPENIGTAACLTHNWRLFVPVGAKQNYEQAEHWNHFVEIIETPLLTGTSTGISDVAAQPKSTAADGVYTTDGRLVARSASTQGLPKGLYIVRENGKARKVIMGR